MLTEDDLQKLEDSHKRIARVLGPVSKTRAGEPKKDAAGHDVHDWEVVYRKPTRAEYKRFRDMSHKPDQVAGAQETLARAIVVHPSREAFDALLEEWPGIAEASGKAFSELAGMTADESAK